MQWHKFSIENKWRVSFLKQNKLAIIEKIDCRLSKGENKQKEKNMLERQAFIDECRQKYPIHLDFKRHSPYLG